MTQSIAGYNAAAKQGKEAAMKYCQTWQADLTKSSVQLAADFTSKKIDRNMYNMKRDALNKHTKDLNDCIQSINRQTGR